MSYLQDISQKKFSLQTQLTFNYDTVRSQTSPESSGSRPTLDWLENTIKSFYGDENPLGMSPSEFAITIMEKINSKKSPEELQTELFDLCGFDRFDMIGAILEKREDLVKSFKVIQTNIVIFSRCVCSRIQFFLNLIFSNRGFTIFLFL